MFFYAIIVSKIVYGISSWYSFLVKAQIAQRNSLFKRAFKYGYVKSVITVEELLESYDDQLFHKASYTIRYDTIEEINVDSKAEYTA